ncbi:MAG: hypothetical protein IJO40_01225 [Thermoguttaceae bacterium]|nr:hypothetical protein [Thermoguttaceae bacterium]
MTKLEKTNLILEALRDGYDVLAAVENVDVAKVEGAKIEGVGFDGETIFGFRKLVNGEFQKIDVTNVDVFKYFKEKIAGACVASAEAQNAR